MPVRIWVLAPSLMRKEFPAPVMVPAKVVLPAAVPIVRVWPLPILTVEVVAPVREAMAWLAPRLKMEPPTPVWSMSTAERTVPVPPSAGGAGIAPATLAFRVPPLMMAVDPV